MIYNDCIVDFKNLNILYQVCLEKRLVEEVLPGFRRLLNINRKFLAIAVNEELKNQNKLRRMFLIAGTSNTIQFLPQAIVDFM